MIARAEAERSLNIDNFDSGSGLEDIVRAELRELLPRRYEVTAGVVSDSSGRTAGDCEIVIFNDHWFPLIKAGATPQSRRRHLPIEGVYGVVEVKQTLTATTLDDAMEKLVNVSRLDTAVEEDRLVENHRDIWGHFGGPRPPKFTAVLAAFLDPNQTFEDLAHRFIAINGQVPRRDVVNVLCVLDSGFLTWAYDTPPLAAPQVTYFLAGELNQYIHPLLVAGDDVSPFYEFITYLLGHLYGQVLAADDLPVKYGASQPGAIPELPHWTLPPDGMPFLK